MSNVTLATTIISATNTASYNEAQLSALTALQELYLEAPTRVQEFLDKLLRCGAHFSIVGGCLRDRILGYKDQVQDIDIFLQKDLNLALTVLKEFTTIEPSTWYGDNFSEKGIIDGVTINIVLSRDHCIDDLLVDNRFTASISEVLVTFKGREIQTVINNIPEAVTSGVIDIYIDQYSRKPFTYFYKMLQKPWASNFSYSIKYCGIISHDYTYQYLSSLSEYTFYTANERTIPQLAFSDFSDLNCPYADHIHRTLVSMWERVSNLILKQVCYPSAEVVLEMFLEGLYESNDLTYLAYKFFDMSPKARDQFDNFINDPTLMPFSESTYDLQRYNSRPSYCGWNLFKFLDSRGSQGTLGFNNEEQLLFLEGKKRLAFSKYVKRVKTPLHYIAVEYFYAMGFKDKFDKLGIQIPTFSTANELLPIIISPKWLDDRFINASITDLADLNNWAHVLGKHALNINKYFLTHFSSHYVNISIPEKFQAQVSKSPDLMTWIFEKELIIDWEAGDTAKACWKQTIIDQYVVIDEATIEQMYKFPGMVEAIYYTKKHDNSHIVFDSRFPTKQYIYNGYTLEILPKQDFRNLCIGDFVSSCQSPGGWGEGVCIDGWMDPHSVNYVVRSPSGKIQANFWAWLTKDPEYIVIDSIEGRNNDSLTDVVIQLMKQFLKDNPMCLLSTTHYGLTPHVVRALKEDYKLTTPKAPPVGYIDYSYFDAKTVYRLSKAYPDWTVDTYTPF